jgi:MFS family permease
VSSPADSPHAEPTRARYVAVAFTLGMIAVAYLDRICISTAAPAIQSELGIDKTRMGFVFSAFTLAYALFEVPSGWFADRFGARVALSRIVVWWSALTAATGFASGFASLLAIRFLFGIGEAGAFPTTARIYARWLPARLHGRLFGVLLMTAALAGAVSQPLVVYLIGSIGWRQSFVVFGAVGMAWALAFWRWFRDDPRAHPAVNAAERRLIADGGAQSHPHAPVPWRALFRSRTLLAICGMYFGSIYGWYFYLTWLPTYLKSARGFSLETVGWLSALALVALAGGLLAGGLFADRMRERLGARASSCLPGLVGLPLAALSAAAAAVTDSPLGSALLLAATAALAGLGTAPAWRVCVEIGGAHSAVVSGAMNTFGNLGGALSPIVVGYCVDRLGSWNLPLFTIAAMYLLAAPCWLAIDPTRPIQLGESLDAEAA